jgi:hydrogenase maturation protein HypF
VEIEIEGQVQKLECFTRQLPQSLPSAAALIRLEHDGITPHGFKSFRIIKEPDTGPLLAPVPIDRAICSECLAEIRSEGNRRSRYPFTSCTQCGPRYTVIGSLPFERADTTMAGFELCGECRNEFEAPGDRRFHAQTTACAICGPEIWSIEGAKELRGTEAITAAASGLAAGKIVALRGLGGYQLLVDATNEAAVRRLRERKGRRAKPLAVMVQSIEMAQRYVYLDSIERAALGGPAAPIVLAKALPNCRLAGSINPGLDAIGVMLPTTPLHAILADDCRFPVICTSANCEGDPLEYEVVAAHRRLGTICDIEVHHNREIVRPVDDNVVRVIAGRAVTIRLARGLAPLTLNLPTMPPMIALGAFLKSAVAWSNGSQAVLGPHVGDQQSLATRERFVNHLNDIQQLYRFQPELIVHDTHPEYFSTQWAHKQPVEAVAVQHHHAHVAAGMLEHGWLDRKVLGVAWDGTGYGLDGTIWGGEFLVSTAKSFERVARLRPFNLPGGEAAIHEPWRIALSLCTQLSEMVDLVQWPGWNISKQQIEPVTRIATRSRLSPLTSSAGRLIDAAAALVLGIDRADYDGQAAMRLEAAADVNAKGCYEFPVSGDELLELDWRPLLSGLLKDCKHGVDPGIMAMRFHRSLAHGITNICRRWRELAMVVSGGVFQNRLLTELVVEMQSDKAQPLGLPGIIPPNDGGLAAGQLAIAAAQKGFIRCA